MIWNFFGEDIDQLILGSNFKQLYNFLIQLFFDKESVYLQMLCTIMLNWIISNITYFFIVII